jgi:hypothetical protein
MPFSVTSGRTTIWCGSSLIFVVSGIERGMVVIFLLKAAMLYIASPATHSVAAISLSSA